MCDYGWFGHQQEHLFYPIADLVELVEIFLPDRQTAFLFTYVDALLG